MGRKIAIAPKLPMTALQYSLLEKISSRHTTGQQVSKRAKILLLASQGEAHSVIRDTLGVSINTIKSWRNRWNAAYVSQRPSPLRYAKEIYSNSTQTNCRLSL